MAQHLRRQFPVPGTRKVPRARDLRSSRLTASAHRVDGRRRASLEHDSVKVIVLFQIIFRQNCSTVLPTILMVDDSVMHLGATLDDSVMHLRVTLDDSVIPLGARWDNSVAHSYFLSCSSLCVLSRGRDWPEPNLTCTKPHFSSSPN